MTENRTAGRLADQLFLWDAGLVDQQGDEIHTGFVALVGPSATVKDFFNVERDIAEFIEANPADENQGYTVSQDVEEGGFKIQRVELRGAWTQIEEITEPGDQIWDMSEDGGKVVERR